MTCSINCTPKPDVTPGLLALLEQEAVKGLAVLGTVKNAGKTEVLMRIISEAEAAGIRLGVTSIGRDGEEKDAVFRNPKPQIIVPKDSLVLTYLNFAGEALPQLQVVETVRKSHFQYGDLAVVKASNKVRLQVAGPSKKSEISSGVKQLAALGAELVLVDGALDRKGAIDPVTVPALILATGMALAPGLEQVVEATAYSVELLQLPLWEQQLPDQSSYLVDGEWQEIGDEMVMGAEENFAAALPDQTEVVYLHGAITDRLLRALKKQKRYPELVVDSPFSIFVGSSLFHSYKAKSGSVWVRQHFSLLAVTVNPWSLNKMIEPEILAEAIKARIPSVRVVDVVAGIYL